MHNRFLRVSQNTRMVIVAIGGALIGLLTYNIIYLLVPWQPRATICWSLSFAIGIARQHSLHRTFTFTYPTPYWQSLGRAYIMYSGSALIGIVINFVLTSMFSVDHMIAWLVCLLVTASISCLFLKKKVFIQQG